MLGDLFKKILGDKAVKDRKTYQPIIDKVNEIFDSLSTITDDELRERTKVFQQRIHDGTTEIENEIQEMEAKATSEETSVTDKEHLFEQIDKLKNDLDKKIEEILEEILPDAFATVKETARRWAQNKELVVTATDFDKKLAKTFDGIKIDGDKAIWKNSWTAAGSLVEWNMIHYDVQIMGGAVLHRGNIAEMQTGEGKTLVATLPVYLNALAGKGLHVVTVNDYLARRDSEWMGPLYQFHGLTVDCIDKHKPNSPERKEAYKANITFGTNNEFGFDYLRDNMSSDIDSLVQKKHHYAIIDEVDSVLIDDARTPLIISGPTPRGDQQEYVSLRPTVERVYNAQRQLITKILADAKKELAIVNDPIEGEDKKETKRRLEEGGQQLLRAYRGLPKNRALIKFLSEPGIKAILQKTENFYMAEQNKHMPFIDKELYFTIDEKNNTVQLTDKGIELMSGTDDPNFYVMPDIGTELAQLEKQNIPSEELAERKSELIRDYSLKSERIHSVNQLLKAYTLFEKEVEYVVIDNKVKIVDESTGRIMEGRRYSDGLHQAIEAKENVDVEAATQTYATISLQNYFRMYHKLAGMTGTAETEAKEFWDIYELDVVVIPTNKPIAREDKNDKVYKTAREKYNAVIIEIEELVNQGRPVLVGTTTVEISELLSRMLQRNGIKHNVLNAKHHQQESEIVANAGLSKAVTIATNMAGRGTDIKLGEGVKEAGGLAIIGTERHDSRRVDRQLRGRAGRQGDPGSSQFFVSLEDDLMRKFGSERIARLMDRMGLQEGEVIQHGMISKSIERAQKKVEENNFGIRKHLLEYDDVMNAQRKAIYKKRRNALYGDRLDLDIANMFYDTVEAIVYKYNGKDDYHDFELELLRVIGIESPIDVEKFVSQSQIDTINDIYNAALDRYDAKNKKIAELLFENVKQHYVNPENRDKHIRVPITDGKRGINVSTTIQEGYDTKGKSIIKEFEKVITLGLIDNEWKEHLREMDDLRTSVQQARYEQKDPLLVYKLESFELFKTMVDKLNMETVEFLVRATIPMQENNSTSVQNQAAKQKDSYARAQSGSRGSNGNQQFQGSQGYDEALRNSQQQSAPQKQEPVIAEKKVGRNDPCPCGSGKKYKQCHGKP
ncbi:MAG: preprotein translocase subunit SecA [Brumimicrobium sp.]